MLIQITTLYIYGELRSISHAQYPEPWGVWAKPAEINTRLLSCPLRTCIWGYRLMQTGQLKMSSHEKSRWLSQLYSFRQRKRNKCLFLPTHFKHLQLWVSVWWTDYVLSGLMYKTEMAHGMKRLNVKQFEMGLVSSSHICTSMHIW